MDPLQPEQPSQLPDYMQQPVAPPPKPFLTRKKITILLSIIGVLFLCIVAIIGFAVWKSNVDKNFQAYAPTTLPSGISITNHATSNVTVNGEQYKLVRLSTSNKDFSIGQEKSDQAQFDATSFACKLLVAHSNCATLKSPAGQSYDVRTSYDVTNKPFAESVAWLKDNTRFWISLQHDQVTKYPNDSWGKIIDSFQSVSYGSE